MTEDEMAGWHGFSRQEYWSGLPWSTSGDLSNPGIEPRCPPLQVDSTREAQEYWSEYPIPSPGNPTKPGIDSGSPESQADFLPAELPGKPLCFSCSVLYLKLLSHLFICVYHLQQSVSSVFLSLLFYFLCVCIFVSVCLLLGILEGLDSQLLH